MQTDSLKSIFFQNYGGEVKDPVLDTLLDSLDLYQERLEERFLLSAFAERSDQVTDGFYEVFCRHLFGQMFPGPAFVVAQASLRDPFNARPITLEPTQHFSLHDAQGSKALFTPRCESWILPSVSNEVDVRVAGADLQLGLGIISGNLGDGTVPVSLYFDRVDPLLIERIRCRMCLISGKEEDTNPPRLPFTLEYPGVYAPLDEFFSTPIDHRFIRIPAGAVFREGMPDDDGRVWLTLSSLGSNAPALQSNVKINAFPAWNFIRKQAVARKDEDKYFRIPMGDHRHTSTIVASVEVEDRDGVLRYHDAARVMDPGYVYQYTAMADNDRDEIVLNLVPFPENEPQVSYFQYDTGSEHVGIASGSSFGLDQGIDVRARSIQTVTPTYRLEILNDKKRVWEYFRSIFASRNRIVTREDMRAGILRHPVFAHEPNPVDVGSISFLEKIGRLPSGALTPYTNIDIPVRERWMLESPDREHFEKSILRFLRLRCIASNVLHVRLVQAMVKNA